MGEVFLAVSNLSLGMGMAASACPYAFLNYELLLEYPSFLLTLNLVRFVIVLEFVVDRLNFTFFVCYWVLLGSLCLLPLNLKICCWFL